MLLRRDIDKCLGDDLTKHIKRVFFTTPYGVLPLISFDFGGLTKKGALGVALEGIILIIRDDLFIFKLNVYLGDRMPLVDLEKIAAQEQKFRTHISEFIKPRTKNSKYPEECVKLLKGKFSKKLEITDPEINFFCYDNLEEYLVKKEEIVNHPKYVIANQKTSSGQPRAALNAYEAFLRKYGTDVNQEDDQKDGSKNGQPLNEQKVIQQILFGAPGTGKSYKIDQDYCSKELLEKEFTLFLKADPALNEKSVESYCTYCNMFESRTGESFFNYTNPLSFFDWREKYKDTWDTKYWVPALNKYTAFLASRFHRTTFHPDYDYAQFVGAFKPTNKTGPITYEFTPQVFTKAYIVAWQLFFSAKKVSVPATQVYLVIEEINRGNCAQIFGDIFQLLDRDGNGLSQYLIDADEDLSRYIEKTFSDTKQLDDYVNMVGEGKLRLPPNFNILATMNTSDQSLFPMDSAFKRRFDWEYVPINYEHPDAGFDIKIDGKLYKWLEFLKVVNKNVYDVTKSEDKQMGEFFIKHSVDYKEFRSKVLFYLWDSVYKDEIDNRDATVFQIETGKFITFQSLFEGDEETQKNLIKKILSNLEIAEREEVNPAQ